MANKSKAVPAEPCVSVADLGPIFASWSEINGRKAPINSKTGTSASTKDPRTWSTRAVAEAHVARHGVKHASGIGVMLTALRHWSGWRLAAIDLDGCRGPVTGNLAPWAAPVVDRFGSYAEVSPSGTGVHVLFLCRDSDVEALRGKGLIRPDAMGNPGAGRSFALSGEHREIAVFVERKFLTLTEEILRDAVIRPVGFNTLEWLLAEHGPASQAREAIGVQSMKRDESGSGYAFRLLLDLFKAGKGEEDARSAIAEDEGPAGEWWARLDERQQDPAVQRAMDQVAKARNDLLKDFDDIEDPTDGLDEEALTLIHGAEEAKRRLAAVSGVGSSLMGFALDEDGVIRAFTERHKEHLRFDHHAGRWFLFDCTHWRKEETKLGLAHAREVSTTLALRNSAAKALKKVSAWEAVERGARTDRAFAVDSTAWDRDPMLLGTPGGTVELMTGNLRPARGEDYISRITAVAPVPLNRFDPARDCPQWLALLDQALAGDANAIRFLQQWGGYSLTGDTREQVLLFVYGPGGSGKGTVINTIAEILGDYAINVAMETLTASKHDRHSTELARLKGARMARASETEKGRAWAENRIKTLTGQDKVTAHFMRQDDFEFMPEFKLTIFGNNRPSLRDVDAAIRRRFIVLPFDHPPVKPDPMLGAKLKAEWPGILSWLILGALDWQASGRLVRPEIVEQATAAYFEEQDTFGQWLADNCEIGPRKSETTERLWESWSRYALSVGEDPGRKMKTFPETLQ